MIEIELTSTESVNEVLHKLHNRIKHRKRLMRAIAGTMESAVLQNFEAGGRPPWQGLKYRQGTPLVDTENLMAITIMRWWGRMWLMRQFINLVARQGVAKRWIFLLVRF